MRSGTLLDAPTDATGAPVGRDLLVLWQHPDTREIIPIGRLSHDADTYCYVYTRAAALIQDFRPLPAMQSLDQRYVSERLPAVFGQRVMEPVRPDYAEYMHSLGLDPARATPWEQIVYSGGDRAGDTLQFMQVPTVTNGRVCARFLVSGVRYIPGQRRVLGGRVVEVSAVEHESALQALTPGTRVSVVPEESNPQDSNAALVTHDGVPLGYVPRSLSRSVRELLNSGPVEPVVFRVGDAGTPPHLRLVLDLDLDAPPGFTFDRDGLWEPLA
jgi:hypothetical protein